jgi:FtsP/CotA-like multicopper oxidase with cupredoxin domain
MRMCGLVPIAGVEILMSPHFSRRTFIGTALAAGVVAAQTTVTRAAPGSAKRLVATTRTLDVNGRAARVFGLRGSDGRPGISLDPGERFAVDLVNNSGARTLVHWHGQLPPWKQDGFPWPQTPPFANGTSQSYDFAPIAGTYWMHSHHELQEQSLMTAPLIVRDAAALRDDRQEVVLMLHDFSFRSPDELLAGLTGTSVQAAQAMTRMHEADGARGRIGGAPPAMAAMDMSHPMAGMAAAKPMSGMAMPAGHAGAMAMRGGMHMDLNDVKYDAFLANDRTLVDPEVVRVERKGRVRLRIINGASASQFWVDLGALTGHVVAVDGHPVQPVAGQSFPLAMAQRLDILLDLPSEGAFPIIARLEGSPQRTGIVLATAKAPVARLAEQGQSAPPVDNSLETRLSAVTPLQPRPADLTQTVALAGGMKPYAWSMNGAYWPHVAPLMLTKGQRVEIELVNQSMMAHPIHLHGHVFQVVGLNGRPLQGAMRDTVLVPIMGRVRIAFDAVNPGRWAFHCHNLYHMQTGMMMEFRYRGIDV